MLTWRSGSCGTSFGPDPGDYDRALAALDAGSRRFTWARAVVDCTRGLLRASPLQAFYSIRPEGEFMEQLD